MTADRQGLDECAADLIEDMYPLSPLQLGMLYHCLQDDSRASYLSQLSFPVPGTVAECAASWQRLVDRHPVLRTAFLWQGLAEPLQVVYRSVALPVRVHDWRALPPAERDRRVAEFLTADRATGFPVDRAPLARLTVLWLDDTTLGRLAVWTHHGLLLDGWSTGLLLNELGGQVEPPGPPYREYVRWLAGRDRGASAEFWRAVVGDVAAPTPLPDLRVGRLAEPRPGDPVCRTAESHLSADQTGRVERFLRAQRLPLVVLAQAAWALTLARLGRTDTVLFGLVVSGRSAPIPGIERMVGLLTNTVPVRACTGVQQPVGEWLRGLLAAHAGTLRHEHDSLADIAKLSAVPAGRPLLDSVLVVQNLPGAAASAQVEAPGVAGYESTHYPLTCTLVPGPRLAVRIGYDPAAQSPEAAERIGHCLRRALVHLVEDADRPVSAVPVLPEPEQVVVAASTGPVRRFPGAGTVPGALAAMAAAQPTAPAIVAPTRVSYGELDRRGNRLAHRLIRAGVGVEDRVAILMPRGVPAVVGTIGVLKAGAAYVPIDPGYPADRLRYLLAQTAPRAVLTCAALAPTARAALRGTPVWVIGDGAEESSGGHGEVEPDRPPPPRCRPDNIAYVIFTSGSTGAPKGVMTSHRAVLNTLRWFSEAYPVRPGVDVVAHKVPVSFTDAVFEVLWPLTAGAALAILDDAEVRDTERFCAQLRAHRVTFCQVVPRQVEAMATVAALGADTDPLPDLRWVVNGGEAMPLAFAAAWDRTFRHGRIANVYGMTESAIYATNQPMARGRAAELGGVPIGVPIANTGATVLNQALEPCPIGVPGELYLTGTGFARGYLGRPGLTAERFVPGPRGTRLYRTGDLACWRPDGTLDVLGRLDHQVKVHGARIEPGEVEAVLRTHPAVRDAVVVGRSGRLVGYLVGAGGDCGAGGTDVDRHPAVRDWLRTQLPGHLVPADLVWLPALPLTAHGKVNRAALPDPVPAHPAAQPPADPLERLVAGVWADTLGVAAVGRNDDFFQLGGDSLQAVRLVGRLREVLPVPYPVSALLAGPTVAECARDLAALLAESPEINELLDELLEPDVPEPHGGGDG